MAHFRFKITLRGISKPPIWRSVDLPATTPFDIFSQVIQEIFGWGGEHLWHFTPNAYGTFPVIAEPVPIQSIWAENPDLVASQTTLERIFHNVGDKFTYTYDFGDDWIHDIVLEGITDEDSNKVYLLKAKGMTPPENCGGVGGYMYLKEVLSDRSHPDHDRYCEYLGIESDESIRFDDPGIECGALGEIMDNVVSKRDTKVC